MKSRTEIEALIKELQQENENFIEDQNDVRRLMTSDILDERNVCYLNIIKKKEAQIKANQKTIFMLQWVLRDDE